MQQSEHQPSAPLPTITPVPTATAVFDPQSITRPDHRLQTYYLILGAISGIIPLFPLLAKFHTLQYRFDDEGVSMKWGLLFRHEVHLTYRRIQDIHLTRNLLQRWLGLATVSIQTASGSATPEMKIEGILQADALRDHLYQRMRGARGLMDSVASPATTPASTQAERIESLLVDIRDALQRRTSPHDSPSATSLGDSTGSGLSSSAAAIPASDAETSA